jgi:hypothetical protein
MTGTFLSRRVCSLLPSLDTRSYHLPDRLPFECPQHTISDRRQAACVMRSHAQETVRGAPSSRQRRRNDSRRRGSRIDIYDWGCYADRLA